MASILRAAAKRIASSAAGEQVLHLMHGHRPRILTYHRFPPSSLEGFEQQCKYLRDHYHPIPLDELVTAVRERKPLPPRSVVLTIDDGYLDVFANAAPLLHRYDIPATAYLVSGFLDRKIWMWPDRIAYAFLNSSLERADLNLPDHDRPVSVELGAADRRRSLAYRIAVYLTRKDSQITERTCHSLAQDLRVDIPETPMAPYEPMSWEQARKLPEYGFTIGAHSVTHPVLGGVHDYETRRREILDSRQRIREMTGLPVDHFCFPNGGIGDFSHVDLELIREAGYRSAVTTLASMITPQTDCYQLPRLNADAEMPLDFFRMKIAGRLYFTFHTNVPQRLSLDLLDQPTG